MVASSTAAAALVSAVVVAEAELELEALGGAEAGGALAGAAGCAVALAGVDGEVVGAVGGGADEAGAALGGRLGGATELHAAKDNMSRSKTDLPMLPTIHAPPPAKERAGCPRTRRSALGRLAEQHMQSRKLALHQRYRGPQLCAPG
jgi:hypothetical protein